ncbi:MAG: peptide ligase PGM1-related protein [Spirosomataceae bacterium]
MVDTQSIQYSDLYQSLQQRLVEQFGSVFHDPMAPKTVVVVPSLTLDEEILSRTGGDHVFYEERLLCLLMLLRMPRTHVIYLSSLPISPIIVDYYLHLLPGVTYWHAQKRLTMLSCYDNSVKSLTEKILLRPRLIQSIKEHIPPNHAAHLAVYNVTKHEQELALRLELPIYGCNPDLYYLGTKSGSRKIFKQVNIPLPDGFEDLKSKQDVIEALCLLKTKYPAIRKAVVKLNDGFSGDGNAVFRFDGLAVDDVLKSKIEIEFESRLKIVSPDISYELYLQKIVEMQAIVELFIEGEIKTSPSVQCRITPTSDVEVISTHDQVLGGESNQVYIGASFPADREYAVEIAKMAKKVAEQLKIEGVLGRFGIDFLSVKEDNIWKHYAIEINLRKGGTTHPFLMLQYLTDGYYDYQNGIYTMPNGQNRYYFTSDNLKSERYKGITPPDLIDIAICNGLHYDAATQEGVMFHMIGALSEFGKIGVVCIGKSPQKAINFYNKTVEVFDKNSY